MTEPPVDDRRGILSKRANIAWKRRLISIEDAQLGNLRLAATGKHGGDREFETRTELRRSIAVWAFPQNWLAVRDEFRNWIIGHAA